MLARSGVLRGVQQQVWAVYVKNATQLLRSWRSAVVVFAAPVFFCALCFVLQLWYNELQNSGPLMPRADSAARIPQCTSWNGVRCVTLAYAPSNSTWVNSVMADVAARSALTLGVDVLALDSLDAIRNRSLAQPNATQAAVYFDVPTYEQFGVYAYVLVMNISQSEFDVTPNVQAAVDGALLRYAGPAPHADIAVSVGGYPYVPRRQVSRGDVVAATGSLWFYSAAMFPWMQYLQQLVGEKESGLRAALYTTGLRRATYWMAWLLYAMTVNVLQMLVLIAAGMAFQFDAFLHCDFSVLLVTLTLFTLGMFPIAQLMNVLIGRGRTANTAGFVFFIVGFLMQSFLSMFGIAILYDPANTPIPREVFYFYPPFNFAKAFSDITQRAYPVYDGSSGTWVPGPGYSWGDMFNPVSYVDYNYSAPPTVQALQGLLMNFAVFSALALFLDSVLGDQGTRRRPLWFLCTPSFWGCRCWRTTRRVAARSAASSDSGYQEIAAEKHVQMAQADAMWQSADDVREEREHVHGLVDGGAESAQLASVPLCVVGLHKVYKPTLWCCADRSRTVYAVRGLYLHATRDTVLCLLGHNGAGKTTTIKMLMGQETPTSGEAFVGGASVSDDIDRVQQLAGVCPQHDTLWDELTALEHMRMFARVRGLVDSSRGLCACHCSSAPNEAGDAVDAHLMELLRQVHLDGVAHQRAGTFSGGMKRRLSLAISCVGNPMMILLDEPTTGLDPVSRREVQEVVQRIKIGRAVLLTTHNMEEADLLADRIAVMAAGQLRCVGDPLELKARYGAGYSVTVVSRADGPSTDALCRLVQSRVPTASLRSSNAGSLVFSVPAASQHLLPALLQALAEEASAVSDYALSHTTLEDVYLAVTHAGDRPLADAVHGVHRPVLLNKRSAQQIGGRFVPQHGKDGDDAGAHAATVDVDDESDDDTASDVRAQRHTSSDADERFVTSSRAAYGVGVSPLTPAEPPRPRSAPRLPLSASRSTAHEAHSAEALAAAGGTWRSGGRAAAADLDDLASHTPLTSGRWESSLGGDLNGDGGDGAMGRRAAWGSTASTRSAVERAAARSVMAPEWATSVAPYEDANGRVARTRWNRDSSVTRHAPGTPLGAADASGWASTSRDAMRSTAERLGYHVPPRGSAEERAWIARARSVPPRRQMLMQQPPRDAADDGASLGSFAQRESSFVSETRAAFSGASTARSAALTDRSWRLAHPTFADHDPLGQRGGVSNVAALSARSEPAARTGAQRTGGGATSRSVWAPDEQYTSTQRVSNAAVVSAQLAERASPSASSPGAGVDAERFPKPNGEFLRFMHAQIAGNMATLGASPGTSSRGRDALRRDSSTSMPRSRSRSSSRGRGRITSSSTRERAEGGREG